MAQTIPGGAYLAEDGKTWIDANGRPIVDKNGKPITGEPEGLSELQEERDRQVAEQERVLAIQAAQALPGVRVVAGNEFSAPQAPLKEGEPDKARKVTKKES